MKEAKKYGELDTDTKATAILISVLFAFFHASMEITILVLNAQIYEIEWLPYTVISYNGLLGWVPFVNRFREPDYLDEKAKDPLNYETFSQVILGLNFSSQFYFGSESRNTFMGSYARLPDQEDKSKRPGFMFNIDQIELD